MRRFAGALVLAAATAACSVQDRTTVQPTPATATTTTYSTPAPASTTTRADSSCASASIWHSSPLAEPSATPLS